MADKASQKGLETLETSYEVLRSSILEHFGTLPDHREDRSKKHKIIDIIFMTICSVIAGSDNLKEIMIFVRAKRDWFQSVLELPNGLPSYSTFWWIFVMIKPEILNKCFVNWVNALVKAKLGKYIAIDGKALRGTQTGEESFIHMVSAWASDLHLTLAQQQVDCKSNEITAIPAVLEALDLENTTVTIDAMGCQKEISKLIRKKNGNYILALKGNQGLLHDEIINFFDQALEIGFEGIEHDQYMQENKGHGRTEKRNVYVTADIDWLPQKEDWEDLATIVMVVSERTIEKKVSKENRYYISSCEAQAKEIADGIRSHWSIENSCHWILDMAFREDDLKGRTGYFGVNMALIRRVALNLLKQDKSTKAGIKAKRKKAGWDQNYLEKIISVDTLL